MATNSEHRRALRMHQVIDRVGLSKAQIYRLIKSGNFPKGVKLSERIVIFDSSDIEHWLASKFGSAS